MEKDDEIIFDDPEKIEREKEEKFYSILSQLNTNSDPNENKTWKLVFSNKGMCERLKRFEYRYPYGTFDGVPILNLTFKGNLESVILQFNQYYKEQHHKYLVETFGQEQLDYIEKCDKSPEQKKYKAHCFMFLQPKETGKKKKKEKVKTFCNPIFANEYYANFLEDSFTHYFNDYNNNHVSFLDYLSIMKVEDFGLWFEKVY